VIVPPVARDARRASGVAHLVSQVKKDFDSRDKLIKAIAETSKRELTLIARFDR
jgi:hypothetical protein